MMEVALMPLSLVLTQASLVFCSAHLVKLLFLQTSAEVVLPCMSHYEESGAYA